MEVTGGRDRGLVHCPQNLLAQDLGNGDDHRCAKRPTVGEDTIVQLCHCLCCIAIVMVLLAH